MEQSKLLHLNANITPIYLLTIIILRKALQLADSPKNLIFTLNVVERTNCSDEEKNQDKANKNAG